MSNKWSNNIVVAMWNKIGNDLQKENNFIIKNMAKILTSKWNVK